MRELFTYKCIDMKSRDRGNNNLMYNGCLFITNKMMLS